MKVLVVSSKYPPEYAGSGLRAHQTYIRLKKKYGIDFDVLAGSVTFNKSKTYLHEGVRVQRIADKTVAPLLFVKALSRSPYLKRLAGRIFRSMVARLWIDFYREAFRTYRYLSKEAHRYDVFHVFGANFVTSTVLLYAKIHKKPVVVELVNLMDDLHHPLPPVIERLYSRRFPTSSLIVCISKKLADQCKKLGYSEAQIWCRPNPVDESKYNFEPAARKNRREFWGIEDNKVVILHLAKFWPLKNQIFSVRVLRHLPQNYSLVLAGPTVESGPLAERDKLFFALVQKEIERSPEPKRIHVVASFIQNPFEYIKAADVVVVPSTSEAFGTPAYEAIACGVPAVVHDIPGVFDQWIENGKNGYICDLDEKRFADKIMLAVKMPPSVRKSASEQILSILSTTIIDEQYRHRLCGLIGSP